MRRLLALGCTLALLLPVMPAAAAPAPYTHVWLAEEQVGGDRGGSAEKRVERDEMTLALVDGRFVGRLRYADVLTLRPAAGVGFDQRASIEVTLTGVAAEGGAAAAGTFEGTAVIDRGEPKQTLEVSGHWGARLSQGRAVGQLLYERATARDGALPVDAVIAPEEFDRLSVEKGGGGQTFDVDVRGLAVASGAGAQSASASGGAGFLRYVEKGLSGEPQVQAQAVPLALSKDAAALKAAAPPGATPLPAGSVAMNVDLSGPYLDAKNRAAGLVDENGPSGTSGSALKRAWTAPAAAAVPPAETGLPLAALQRQRDIPGARELAADLGASANTAAADPRLLAAWRAVIAAVGSTARASVLEPTAAELRAVQATPVPPKGPPADALLAAAQDPAAPRQAVVIAAMSRAPSLDTSGNLSGGLLPNRVLARTGGSTQGGSASFTYPSAEGRTTLAPASWPAYRREDGTDYWLAGPDGPVALTDGTLRGAGFVTPRAYLVDAADVGRILAVYDLR